MSDDTTIVTQIASRLDRIDARLDKLSEDLSVIRSSQVRSDERLQYVFDTFRQHESRISQLELFMKKAEQRFAVERNEDFRSKEKWQKFGIVTSVAATWLALLGKALGFW